MVAVFAGVVSSNSAVVLVAVVIVIDDSVVNFASGFSVCGGPVAVVSCIMFVDVNISVVVVMSSSDVGMSVMVEDHFVEFCVVGASVGVVSDGVGVDVGISVHMEMSASAVGSSELVDVFVVENSVVSVFIDSSEVEVGDSVERE